MHAIFEDDYVAGIRDAYTDHLKAGAPHEEARERVLRDESLLPMPDTASLVWLALAATQHTAGHDDALVRRCAAEALDDDEWVDAWGGGGAGKRAMLASLRTWLDTPVAEPLRIEIVPRYRADAMKPTLESELLGMQKQLRADLLGNLDLLAPRDFVAALALALDRVAVEGHDEKHRKAFRTSFGVALAAVLRREGWKWGSAVDTDGDPTACLVRADKSAWFSPFTPISAYLESPDRKRNVLVELYDAFSSGGAPAAAPDAMLDLGAWVDRLVDAEWPDKRAKLVAREGVDDPAAALGDAFAALGAMSGQDFSGLSDALTGMAKAAEALKEMRGGGSQEATVKLPPAADAVARRALLLLHQLDHLLNSVPPEAIAAYQQGWPGDSKERFAPAAARRCEERLAELEASGLAADLDPAERKFLGTPLFDVPMPVLIQYSWRGENLHCLLWALGATPTLLPWDVQTGPAQLDLAPLRDGRAFVRAARLRPAAEIAEMRDRAEMWNWRARTRRLAEEGRPFPPMPQQGLSSWDDVVRFTARGLAERRDPIAIVDEDLAALGKAYRDLDAEEYRVVSGIAQERHFALNWLCGFAQDNRWSVTPTGT